MSLLFQFQPSITDLKQNWYQIIADITINERNKSANVEQNWYQIIADITINERNKSANVALVDDG